MPYDNDLLTLWLRAGELTRDQVRELIDLVQAARHPSYPPVQHDEVRPA